MKKDVRGKVFPRTAHHITACQLDWLVTSASQRIKRGFIPVSTLFPFVTLFRSLLSFLSLFPSVRLISLAKRRRGNRG